MEDIKKIIILGHTSFIGRSLIILLKSKYPEIKIIGVNSKHIDLTSLDQVAKLKRDIDSHTIVVMLAANLRQTGASIDDFIQNMKMAENLCFLFEKCPPKKFVFFSTNAVYGEDTENIGITEHTGVNPTSYYGIAKFTAERLFCKTFESYENNSLLILRMPRIYGPNAKSTSRGPTMFTYNAFFKNITTIWGEGLELRSYVFIDDLIDITTKLMFLPVDGVINVANEDNYSFMNVIESVEEVCKYNLEVIHKTRTRPSVNHSFNNNKLKTLIGNYKFTPLNVGINTLWKNLLMSNNSN